MNNYCLSFLCALFLTGAPIHGATTSQSGLDSTNVLLYGADPTGTSDSTAAIQSALNATTFGKVLLPAQSNGAKALYKVSQIKMSRAQTLIGSGSSSTILMCGSNSTPCIAIGDKGGDSGPTGGGVSYLTLYGPGNVNANTGYGATGAGASVGIYAGGDPAGAILPSSNYGNGLIFRGLSISNFSIGMQLGNNSWGYSFFDATFATNATGFFIPSGVANTGEGMSFHGGVFANNTQVGLSNQNGSETFFFGSAFDYNAMAINGGSPTGGPYISAFGTHFEQTSGKFIDSGGSPALIFSGCDFLYNGGAGVTDPTMINVHSSYPAISINGGTVYAGHPTTYFLQLTTTATPATPVSVTNMSLGGAISALSNAVLPQVVRLSPAYTACNGNTRGVFAFVLGSNNTADSVQICSKMANGTYSWVIH